MCMRRRPACRVHACIHTCMCAYRLLQQAAAPVPKNPAASGPGPQPGLAQGPMPPGAAAGPVPPGDAVAAAPNSDGGTPAAILGGAVSGVIARVGEQQQLEVSLWFQVSEFSHKKDCANNLGILSVQL